MNQEGKGRTNCSGWDLTCKDSTERLKGLGYVSGSMYIPFPHYIGKHVKHNTARSLFGDSESHY